jgi:hypothetical protein
MEWSIENPDSCQGYAGFSQLETGRTGIDGEAVLKSVAGGMTAAGGLLLVPVRSILVTMLLLVPLAGKKASVPY